MMSTGFTDWRVRGVVGIRPTIMQFLLTVQVRNSQHLDFALLCTTS
jgi:hypothetical protein